MGLPDTVLPAGLDACEVQEAYRCLKGQTLRIEVYAQDGGAAAGNPYSVTEQNFSLLRLQPRGPNQHAVFLSHPRERLAFNYERSGADPRVTHDVTLGFDAYGNVTRGASVAYPRRPGYAPPEPALSVAMQDVAYDQTRLHVSATETATPTPSTTLLPGPTISARRPSPPASVPNSPVSGRPRRPPCHAAVRLRRP